MHHNPLPILQSIAHGGLAAPPEVEQRLAISQTDLYNECDLWAEHLYDFSHASLALLGNGHPRGVLGTVTTPIARALVDVNRRRDDLANPDGPVKSQTSYGVPIYAQPLEDEQKLELRNRYWEPYHARLGALLAAHQGQAVLLLDCHNMAQHGPTTYDFAGAARPLVCLANLGNRHGEPRSARDWITCPGWLLREAGALASRLFADMTLLEPDDTQPPIVALNWPFIGGVLIEDYAVGDNEQFAHDPARAPYAIMIEVNRGLFVGNQSATTPMAPPNLERIAMIRERLYRWITGVVDLIEQAEG